MFALPTVIRYPGEGDNAYAAFTEYLALGWDMRGENPRRIARHGAALDRMRRRLQPNVVDGWQSQFEWEHRASEYDAGIVQAIATLIRDTCSAAQANVAAFATMATNELMGEFERSLESMRGKKQTIPLPELVAMGEKLTKLLSILAPRIPDEGKSYQPDLGYPEDQMIAEEAARLDVASGRLAPGEPPPPGFPMPELPAPGTAIL